MRTVRYFLLLVFSGVFCFNSGLFGYSGGTGSLSDPYQIANKADLLELAGTVDHYGKQFILIADINLSDEFFTSAVIAADTNSAEGGFQGTYFSGGINGDGYVISNLMIYAPEGDYVGLIGNLDGSNIDRGNVKNLVMENVDVVGRQYVGGLVGNTRNWAVRIEDCGVTGMVYGQDDVGGLVGFNWGNSSNAWIGNCFSDANVGGDEHIGGLVGRNWGGAINNSYASGYVHGDFRIGGLAGRNAGGSVSNCYSRGEVEGLERVGGLVGENENMIDRSYSIADVNGENWVGGLVGSGDVNNVTRSFWDVDRSNQTESAGGTGLVTELMQDINTYLDAEWDFVDETENGTDDIWKILFGGGYPCFYWESLPNDKMSGAAGILAGDVILASSVGASGDDITVMGYEDWADVWFYFNCDEGGKYTVSVETNGFDSTVAVFDEGGKEIVFNDDFFGGKSEVVLKASAERTYYIRVAGYDGQTGEFSLLLEAGGMHVIQGDLNYDGFVDLVDFAIMADSWLIE